MQQSTTKSAPESTDALNCRSYDAIAARWYASHPNTIHNDERSYIAMVSNITRVLGGRLLDIGCGFGRFSDPFIEAGLKYTGIDISPKVVALAKQRNPQADFRVMSFNKMEFSDGTFHGFWCMLTLQHERKDAIAHSLREIRRVMRRGGIGFIVIFDGAEEGPTQNHWTTLKGYRSDYTLPEFASKLIDAGYAIVDAQTLRLEMDETQPCNVYVVQT